MKKLIFLDWLFCILGEHGTFGIDRPFGLCIEALYRISLSHHHTSPGDFLLRAVVADLEGTAASSRRAARYWCRLL